MSNLSELETVIAPDPVDEEQLVAQSKNVLLFDDIYFAAPVSCVEADLSRNVFFEEDEQVSPGDSTAADDCAI